MNFILKLYLIGIVFNLVVSVYHYYRGRRTIRINIKGIIGFVLASWIIYPLVLLKSRRY